MQRMVGLLPESSGLEEYRDYLEEARRMKLFLDVNVVLDVYARREPWLMDSAVVLSRIAEGSGGRSAR